MHPSVRVPAIVFLVFAAGALTPGRATTELAWPIHIESVDAPAAANSAQPQLAVDGDRAVLSWIERDGPRATLKVAERTRSGWSDARAVASGSDWFVNWADVPSVLPLPDGTLAAHWLQKSASGTYAYDVKLSFSRDEGRTWTPPISPHHDGTPAEHGFASLFPAPQGGLGLVWLDGREMKPDGGHEGHGNMTLRAAQFDGARTQISELVVDSRVCECCPTAAAVTSEGPIVAFRDRSDDEVRDIFVSRRVGGRWTTPVPVHRDNWQIRACPVNGPALTARGANVAIAWFTAEGNQGRVLAAFSSDAGKTFGPPLRIDAAGSLGRVDVEWLGDDSAAVLWMETLGQRTELRVRRIDRSGARSAPITVAAISGARASGYPRLARRGAELLFAWTETDGGLRVRTAVATLRSATERP